MRFFRRALSNRPEDSKEGFFFVKVKKSGQIQGKGIGCAIEKEVRGEKKFFLLTGTDVKNDQGEVFAERCFRSFRRPKRKKIEIGICSEDHDFSFIPLDCVPEKRVKLVAEENIGRSTECRSFVITKRFFKTVYWEYDRETESYQLNPKNTELEEPSAALGSPVLWTDEANGSYVVGVIKRSSAGIFFPHMFTTGSLQLPAVSPQEPIKPDSRQSVPTQPSLNAQDPTQPGSNSQERSQPSQNQQALAQTNENLQEPTQTGADPQEPTQTVANPQELCQTDPYPQGQNLQQSTQTSPDLQEPNQTDLNSQEPTETSQNPQETARTSVNPEELTQTGQNQQESAQTGQNLQESAQTGQNLQEPVQTGQNLEAPAQTGQNPQEPLQTGQNLQESAQTCQNSQGPTQTDDIVNVTVKVPKSVVAFLFLMIFILGIFAMEWWFPWLTGRAIKLCYPSRNP